MQGHLIVAPAAATTAKIVRSLSPDHLDAPTPCGEFAVRDLIDHMLVWGPVFEGAGRKELVVPADGSGVDFSADWVAGLESQIDRIVDLWSEPQAWAGNTHFASPDEMPASMVGGMVCSELVVHGWDLARAIGQNPHWDEDVTQWLYREVSAVAELGREMGAYGPAVPVADTASALERTLGLTGRDPDWTP